MNTLVEDEFGSNIAAAIFDLSTMGLPNLLPDLASRFCLLPRSALCEAVSLRFSGVMASGLGSCLLRLEEVAGIGRIHLEYVPSQQKELSGVILFCPA